MPMGNLCLFSTDLRRPTVESGTLQDEPKGLVQKLKVYTLP